MKRLTVIFLGSTGAGPVYSFEMTKALKALGKYQLQVIISNRVYNLNDWKKQFLNSNVSLEIVETYGHNKIDFVLSLLKFWRINKIINIIHCFNPDALYVPFLLTWDFLIYPRLKKNIRIISTLHDPHPHDKTMNPFACWIRSNNKNAYKYVNDVIILNNRDVAYVKDNFCKNVHVIPHASFSYYIKNTNKSLQLNNTIGFFGRIEPYKGLDLLVDAFMKLDSKYHLLIAGSGKIDREINDKIILNNRIEVINRYIDDDEISDLLNKVDIVVLPYKRASQSGVIPLVFAHGKPVVATNVGALKEQVPEGTGVVTNADVESLITGISALYENPQRIFTYGNNAKRYAEIELSWNNSAKLLEKIIEWSE